MYQSKFAEIFITGNLEARITTILDESSGLLSGVVHLSFQDLLSFASLATANTVYSESS